MSTAALLVLSGLLLAPATPAPSADAALPEGMGCLLAAYPDALCSGTPEALVWCDGTRMAWDDGRAKPDHEARLRDGDLEEQMAQRYPVGRDYPRPLPVDFEPGRVRHEPFFEKLYGASAREVKADLVDVPWLPRTVGAKVRMTRRHGAAEALRAVSEELDRLPPELRRFVEKPGGTFVWRTIKGERRKSMHSFAIAIDVGVALSDYWKWVKPDADGRLPYRNRFPLEVVEAFERHGFIWGGKWYHFDTMHFEYRPELLAPDCRAR